MNSRLRNFIRTVKEECKYTRGDIDEDTACEKVIAKLEIIKNLKEMKHYRETLLLKIDSAGNNHMIKFYRDIAIKLKDIIKRSK